MTRTMHNSVSITTRLNEDDMRHLNIQRAMSVWQPEIYAKIEVNAYGDQIVTVLKQYPTGREEILAELFNVDGAHLEDSDIIKRTLNPKTNNVKRSSK